LAEIVGNMAHPTGNVTGLTLNSLTQVEKCLQLVKEMAPRVTRVSVLRNPVNPAWHGYPEVLNRAAAAVGIELVGVDARGFGEIDQAFATMAADGAEALLVLNDSTFIEEGMARQRIVELAASRGLPSVSHSEIFARRGGLLSLGSAWATINRGAVQYIHRILQGAKPGDLPVVHPTEFKLVVNLQTARALGITVPAALLARVDVVIE
jgi:putative ABC transport system substrate-binding protein